MNNERYDFFREAVLRICSSMNIENVMCECVRHLKKFIPADELILTFYDPGLNAIRTMARATCEKGVQGGLLVQMDKGFDRQTAIKHMPREHICNDTQKEPLNKKIAKAYGHEECSLLQMFLETREQKYGLGHLTLCAKGKNRYTHEHLDLFRMIKEPFTLVSVNILQHRQVLEIRKALEDDRRYLQRELQHLAGDTIIGLEGGLEPVATKIRQVASKKSPVLITGETGVGKDAIANMIHSLSKRSDEAFIKVNCGAIPDELIDSELFGHEKGAFTGATSQKRGRFERAHNGTIFLDEVGELSHRAQVRFLRVLQNKEIERVGGTGHIDVDVRVVAATNKDLEKCVNLGKFREDLWYRLNVFPIHIPSLRERKADIPDLVDHFIQTKAKELQLPFLPGLVPGTIDRMVAYNWPGNVRELQNLIERALIVSEGELLEFPPFHASDRSDDQLNCTDVPESLTLADVNIRHIERVLKLTNGKIHGPGGAAELLDINAGTLRNRMKRLGIVFGRRRE